MAKVQEYYGWRPNVSDSSFQMNDDDGRWRFNNFDEMSQEDQLIWMKKYIYEVTHQWSERASKDVQVSRCKKKLLKGDLDCRNIELFYEFERYKFQQRNMNESRERLTAQMDEKDAIIKAQQEQIEALERKYQVKCECLERAVAFTKAQRSKIKRLTERNSRLTDNINRLHQAISSTDFIKRLHQA